MLLYEKTGCPYCAKVIASLEAHGLTYEKKNVSDEAVVAELIEKGGKKQVPYLIDGDTALYESDAIVSYIETTYGNGEAKPKIRIHNAGGACPS